MSAVTEQVTLTARLNLKTNKIELRCDKGVLVEFIRTLPAARWSSLMRAWTVNATPACAYRIANVEKESDGVEIALDVGEEIKKLAKLFTPTPAEDAQPEVRKNDSWGHQVSGYSFICGRNAALLDMFMGTGKSKIAVDLVINRNFQTTLILCPVTCLGVWRREFELHAGEPRELLILDGKQASKRKAKLTEEYLQRQYNLCKPAVVVVNYETATSEKFSELILSREWDAVFLDESHRIKGHNTTVSKLCSKIGKRAGFRLALTGTPMPHSPLDVFGQFRFLDPGLFGDNYHNFLRRYAVPGHFGRSHIVRWKNQSELAEKMALMTYHAGKDVLDLPDIFHHVVEFDLSAKSRKVYNSLAEELIAEIDSKEFNHIDPDIDLESGSVVTVSNALTKLLRLQQLTSGYCPIDCEIGGPLDQVAEIGTEKQDELLAILDGLPTTEPVVVFCKFKHDLENIRKIAKKTKRRYGELSGRHKDLTQHATMRDDIDLMGVQIQSGGTGIDLTRACYVVYYSVGYSLGDYEQSVARVHRPGQDRTTHYYHLTAKNSVDEAIYKALDSRRQLVGAVVEMLKSFKNK